MLFDSFAQPHPSFDIFHLNIC